MDCPNCASKNLDIARYCTRCGKRLGSPSAATPSSSSDHEYVSHPEQLIRGIVRILDINENIVGTGFVISNSGLIATCSHVIQPINQQKDGKPRPEKVTIVFHSTGDKQDARTDPNWWLPWDNGDVAILHTEGNLPPGVHPLLLGSIEGTSGHDVCTFGFPDTGDIEGIGGDGKVVRVLIRGGRTILQLRSSEITIGFSGAPVWDILRRRVIGMVSDIAQPIKDRLVETAFAVSTETLQQVCSKLQLSDVCPYRGLDAFTEADAEFFFGRQQVLERLLNRLHRDIRFLMVLGPSGSGKSSVVQAGLIPLVSCGKIPGSDRWGIIVTRPGTQPFDELIKQGVILPSQDLSQSIEVWLNQHIERNRLMLVIDQFEELFSICPEDIRQDFITQLARLLISHLPITVVLIMREDFYSRFIEQEALVERMEQSGGPVHLPKHLRKDELVTIVQKPAEAVGLKWEKGLVETIVRDSIDTSAEPVEGERAVPSTFLPLLEFTLTELWRKRQEGMLTHDAYRQIGEVAGALTLWADRAFYTLVSDKRRLAQRILTDLVYVGDESQGILDSRRRQTLTSLCRNGNEQENVEQIVQHLVSHRLLATDRDLQNNKETVEIIHDVLLREWGQLRVWLGEDRRFLTWHQELEKLVRGWIIQHDNNKLLRGSNLTEAQQWLKERGSDLKQDEVAFIRASATHHLRRVVSIVLIVFLLISTTGIASWFVLHQPPNPTYVTNLNNDGTGSLRWALANARAGSTITFAPQLRGTILLTHSDLEITKNLTIRGPGTGILTISSSDNRKLHINPNTSVSISNLSFRDFHLQTNGAIYNQGTLMLMNVNISGNVEMSAPNYSTTGTPLPQSDGGSLYNEGILSLVNSKVLDNTVTANDYGYGGGIYNAGILTLTNSVVSGNHLSCHNNCIGGGIFNGGRSVLINKVSLTLNDSVVSNNTVTTNTIAAGGAIFNNEGSTLSLVRSTIAHNQILSGKICWGGGLFSTGTATITASTVSNNTISPKSCVQGAGGGVFNDQPGKLTLTNSTIAENSASYGGGIFVQNKNSRLSIMFCTISGNTAQHNAGIVVASSTTSEETIADSIVAHNLSASGESDMAGTLTSLGYNLIQHNTTPSSFATNSTDILNVDAMFDSELRSNSGVTQSYALLSDSPAIGKVPLAACHANGITTDQRGMKRPGRNKQNCDIGSFETQN